MGRPKIEIPQIKRNTTLTLINRLGLDYEYLEDKDKICTECKFTHCSWHESKYGLPCPLLKSKNNNKYKKLNRYVYDNLNRYGNTILSYSVYEKLGDEIILKDLAKNGITNVYIKVAKDKTVILQKDY